MGNMLSWFTGRSLLLRIRSIWKHVCSAFTTLQRPMDPAPSVAATSNQNTNIISPSMMVEETQRPTGSDLSDNGRSVLEATPGFSTAAQPEIPAASSVAGSQIDPVYVNEDSNSESDYASDDINDPLRNISSTPQTQQDSPPSGASVEDGNFFIAAPSETVEETQLSMGSDSSEGEDPVLEAIPDSLGAVRPEVPSTLSEAGSQSGPVDDEEANSSSYLYSNDGINPEYYSEIYRLIWRITLPEVTLSAVTETGQAETSIKVPKQQSYTGRSPVITSSLADTPCAELGIQAVLDRLNATLGTTHTLDTPSLSSLLKDYIEKNYDFGTAYARLRPVWNTHSRDRNMQDELHEHEKKDTEWRRNALVGNQIVNTYLRPRRVWDLYSNRVVPGWITHSSSLGSFRSSTSPISHAWVAETDRVDVWTPINRKEWPVPIPKDTDLNLIRIEMLNLGIEYAWLDVLCLRQKGGPREDLRVEEWKLDVPTIGRVYDHPSRVMIYLSGLGRPLSLKDGDLDSDQCWFRRAWTLQEVGDERRIFAGDTPDGPMHAKSKDGKYETELLIRFHKKLELMPQWTHSWKPFAALAEMQKRVSGNEVDKVAGLAFTLGTAQIIPAYYESETLEDAWTALADTIKNFMCLQFLFAYPREGLGHKKWRPSWDQVMNLPLPVGIDQDLGILDRDTQTGEDSYFGCCIEKGLVRGLDVGLAEGHDRHGELIVEGTCGVKHTFKIRVTHQFPIPDDMYTLLCSDIDQLSSNSDSDSEREAKQKQPLYWAVGRRVSGNRFQKVSVFVMDDLEEVQRLVNLHLLALYSDNVLV
ncbi:hypothetical protein ARMGADRAFT_814262 [Armillaria gallica]|uniref:Heterokaryon incompatibility domain-containing protein n=1 Tax=Armillaria gallica TaxID=47427 RepID=A0A2H3CDI8_ARMGA|nr:hypothetical protein ARMGADRAFT_814262 [Armillaria gallica]